MATMITFPHQTKDLSYWKQTEQLVEDSLVDSLKSFLLISSAEFNSKPASQVHSNTSNLLDLGSWLVVSQPLANIMAPVLRERPQSDWLIPTNQQVMSQAFVYSSTNDRVPQIPDESMWLSSTSEISSVDSTRSPSVAGTTTLIEEPMEHLSIVSGLESLSSIHDKWLPTPSPSSPICQWLLAMPKVSSNQHEPSYLLSEMKDHSAFLFNSNESKEDSESFLIIGEDMSEDEADW